MPSHKLMAESWGWAGIKCGFISTSSR